MHRHDAHAEAVNVPADPNPPAGGGGEPALAGALRLAWAPERLQAGLAPHWPGISVRAVASTGSTNSDLLACSGGPPSAPQVLVAEEQTAGRGRQGRVWYAQPGHSLTFSLARVLRPRQGWGALSLVVGHAVAQALQPWPPGGEPTGSGRLMLKWPNDLWWYDTPPTTPSARARGRKLGGILIETVAVPEASAEPGSRWVVIGIGINVHPPGVEGAASTAEWRPHDEAPALWHRIVPSVLDAVARFEVEGFKPWQADVQRRDVLIGQPIVVEAGAVREEGVGLALEADGALRIRLTDGREQRVVAGEVRVRPDGRLCPAAGGQA